MWTFLDTPFWWLTENCCPSRSHHLLRILSIFVLMETDEPSYPGVLARRTCSGRWRALVFPHWGPQAGSCWLPRVPSASWSARHPPGCAVNQEGISYTCTLRLGQLPQKAFWDSRHLRLGEKCFCLFFPLYKKKKKVSKIKLENICSIYFLIVKGSAISWLFPSPLMTNLWELNVLWAIRQDGKDKGRYNLKKPLYGSLWGKCFKDWENRNWGRVIK